MLFCLCSYLNLTSIFSVYSQMSFPSDTLLFDELVPAESENIWAFLIVAGVWRSHLRYDNQWFI